MTILVDVVDLLGVVALLVAHRWTRSCNSPSVAPNKNAGFNSGARMADDLEEILVGWTCDGNGPAII